MKHVATPLLLIGALGFVHAAAPMGPRPARVFAGTITNTTIDAAAPVRIELLIDGETVTAAMKTEPPLSGTGTLEGRFRGGWCELRGKLNEGFAIRMRGACNDADFRGTYVVEVPGSPAQYGKFNLAAQPLGNR